MRVAPVRDRIREEVPQLADVLGALDLAALLRPGGMTQARTPAAYVAPLGQQGSAAEDVAGGFIQGLAETVGVLLLFRDTNAAADRHLSEVEDLILAVTRAVAGWAPPDCPGVFRLARGYRVAADPGSFAYALDFTVQDQLRIIG